jgi:hypothetical protein
MCINKKPDTFVSGFVLLPPLGLPDFISLHRDKLLAQNNTYKKRATFHVTLFFAPPIGKSYNFNTMVEYVIIRKVKG